MSDIIVYVCFLVQRDFNASKTAEAIALTAMSDVYGCIPYGLCTSPTFVYSQPHPTSSLLAFHTILFYSQPFHRSVPTSPRDLLSCLMRTKCLPRRSSDCVTTPSTCGKCSTVSPTVDCQWHSLKGKELPSTN